METLRAQPLSTAQGLHAKLSIDEAVLKKQSGQVDKMQSTLEEIQTIQSTLVDAMTKIEDHVIEDGDQDEISSVNESLQSLNQFLPKLGHQENHWKGQTQHMTSGIKCTSWEILLGRFGRTIETSGRKTS